MNLGKSVVYSVIVHALIIAMLLLIVPAPEKKKAGGEFFTDLVSPEELVRKSPPAPSPKQRSRAAAPAPAIKKWRRPAPGRETPRDQTSRLPADTGLTKAAPAVPNLSKESRGGSTSETHPGNEGSARAKQEPRSVGPTLKEKLFDKKVIGALAKRDVDKKEKNQTFTFDADEYRFLVYNRRLKERIESIWRYPPDAAAQGIYGDLEIKFTIKKNGRLGAVELVRGSGYPMLDKAALEALNEAAPYWPLPNEWNMDAYTIEGHFVYSLYGYYIR